ncbi:ABC transporter substrate-binding protein [Psychrobium sp. 1_MG-2023]|uniref:ABC transporter substrate-binding protein n=1 Tax=Psychrobium sp. 1_MG-2023 TaxID=3062624 RepID=UPI00129281CB|nr:NrtA/SsuA/CpmA family ABC transporter substrate-binding protein [Psychrobium sp. 1_MG-2023]MDP2560672.1 NrtA/SsuA/CpmA family ABC transporter substrate-binding protein [Psychrobium sp. 1_MG-2023]
MWLISGCFLVACSEQNTTPNTSKEVVIAVSKTPLSSPFYVAQKLGYFDKLCGNVVIDDTVGGNNSFKKVLEGQADFATSSDSVMMFQALKGTEFVNLATFVQSDNDVKILALRTSGIVTGKDLINKKIGVTKGAAGEYLLSTYLAMRGIKVSDVDVIDYAPNALVSALNNNDVDAIVPWEPYAYQSISLQPQQIKAMNTKNLYSLTFNLLSLKLHDSQRQSDAACILNALDRAIQYIASEPEHAKQIVMERLSLTQDFIDWVWQDYIFKLSLNRSLILSLESQAVWAIESGLVDVKVAPNFGLHIETKVLAKINPQAVTIQH